MSKILGINISASLAYQVSNNYSKIVGGLDHTYKSNTYAYLYTYGVGNRTKLNIGIYLYTFAGFWYNSETNGEQIKDASLLVDTNSNLTIGSTSGYTHIGNVVSVNGNDDRIQGNGYAAIFFKK